MTELLTGAVAALLLVVASPARAEEPAPPPIADASADRAMREAHREMHEAMLRHAPAPQLARTAPEAAHGPAAHAGEQAHHRVAEQMAQRHAAAQRERHRDPTGDPARRAAHGGAGASGEPGSCDGPAGQIQTMTRHRDGHGGMEGDHTGDPGTTTPGTGTGPHAGEPERMR
jgi:hypothetical protein